MLKGFICLIFVIMTNVLLGQLVHYNRALDLMKRYQIDSAYSEMTKELKNIENRKYSVRAKFYVSYAEILKYKTKSDSSLFYILKAKRWYQKNNNLDSLVYTATFAAELNRYIDNREKCLQLMNDLSKIVNPKIISPNILAYYYNRKLAIQNFYLQKESLVNNHKLIQLIYTLEPKVTSKDIIAYTINEEGSLFEVDENYDQAYLTYQKAFNYSRENSLIIPEIDILLNLSRMETRIKNDLNEAIKYLKLAEELAESIKSNGQLYAIYIDLKNSYYNVGNIEQAFFYSGSVYEKVQAINGEQNYELFRAIERKYSIEIKEKELDLKNIELTSASKRFWYLIITLFMVVILVLVLIYFYRRTTKANKKLDYLSKENEFLLKEANHRINNNLQLILILISSELKKANEEEAIQLKKILSSVGSIATLHKHLYKGNDKNKVQISDYMNEIYKNLFELFKVNDIDSSFKIDPILVQTDTAMYLGLIVTELCINSLKHAFNNQENKTLNVTFQLIDNKMTLDFKDNGKAIAGKTVQPILIDKLCRQLRSNYSISTENGFHIEIILPNKG